ncbi:hypothetical protein An03g02635 [Aspergillus niger]|uniref:Uncharacterized protein n=2 Tax=Aspergillus niger TaxID=5061 RepID=A2QGC1_ASPNC|nr:hypothetical protein An03g02635 [Aspergillus niger]CAK44568.1 hypothetical protein An03g02635 [Aspergillus niger]
MVYGGMTVDAVELIGGHAPSTCRLKGAKRSPEWTPTPPASKLHNHQRRTGVSPTRPHHHRRPGVGRRDARQSHRRSRKDGLRRRRACSIWTFGGTGDHCVKLDNQAWSYQARWPSSQTHLFGCSIRCCTLWTSSGVVLE